LRTPKNLTNHELIGLPVQIVTSPRASEIGLQGIVIDETKNTLTIRTLTNRMIVKKGRKLCFKIGRIMIVIDGNALVGRPEERIKSKKWKKRY